MLHIYYVEEEAYDKELYYIGGPSDIQEKLCSYLERIYYTKEPNPLRSDKICQYLRELYDIEWVDDYTILMKGNVENRERKIVTALAYDIQLTMQLIHLSEHGVQRIFLGYVPWISNFKWLSDHCELTVYVRDSEVIPVDYNEQREKDATYEKGLFDFSYKGIHYDSCWHEFCMIIYPETYSLDKETDYGKISFKEIRKYYTGTNAVSILVKESMDYQRFHTMEKVPVSYDEKYLVGFRMADDMEFVVSERPERGW